jgi:uncharacterized protein (TIGR02284 family)
MASDERQIQTLNGLIQICKGGENGYRTAAGGVRTPDLKQLFESYSAQRALFANELQAEVQRLAGQPQEGGSIAATLHRGWMNLKGLVTGQDEAAIIAECERGEDAAVKAYEEAVHADLPDEVKKIVLRQFDQVKEAHARVRALEVALAKA